MRVEVMEFEARSFGAAPASRVAVGAAGGIAFPDGATDLGRNVAAPRWRGGFGVGGLVLLGRARSLGRREFSRAQLLDEGLLRAALDFDDVATRHRVLQKISSFFEEVDESLVNGELEPVARLGLSWMWRRRSSCPRAF
jgi:hypothetical protein